MSTNTNIDYINNNFEFKTLHKIDDIPTYEDLIKIKNQLMANANKVPTDLGGGTNGHLGLVLSTAEYSLISQIPYDKAQHPGPLPPINNNDLPATVVAREEYKDNLCLF